MNTQQTPDYGEPWGTCSEYVVDRRNKAVHLYVHKQRVAQCVNACAGMTNPAAEIAAMREAIKEAYDTLEQIYNHGRGSEVMPGAKDDHPDCSWCSNFRSTQSALTKLKPFLKP